MAKPTVLEKLENQKAKLLQKQEALKAEAKRIAKAESDLARKTRTGQLVALGLLCEAMVKAGAAKIPLASIKKYLKRDVDIRRAMEILQATVQDSLSRQPGTNLDTSSSTPSAVPTETQSGNE